MNIVVDTIGVAVVQFVAFKERIRGTEIDAIVAKDMLSGWAGTIVGNVVKTNMMDMIVADR